MSRAYNVCPVCKGNMNEGDLMGYGNRGMCIKCDAKQAQESYDKKFNRDGTKKQSTEEVNTSEGE